MTIWSALAAVAAAFAITAVAMPLTQKLARRFNFMDVPARHKAHGRAVPLLGGCAILAGFLLPSVLAMALVSVWAAQGAPAWLGGLAVHVPGAAGRVPMGLGILGGAVALHVLGLIDDRRALGPWIKLAAQLAICLIVVLAFNVRVLTAVSPAGSVILSVLWLAGITNAFNFLDNMDGLSAGVAAICCAALLGTALSMGQVFVSAWLCLLLGALLGFLPYNFPPARSFMGDAGSMVIGYLLAVLSTLTTYVQPGQTYYAFGIFVPLVLLAVPIYDMVSVILLRIRARSSPIVGDRRHFSHRLLRRGMSVRKVVLTIYLCTGATAASALLLAHLRDSTIAFLVFAQVVCILLVIALLESAEGKP